jgi:hypothetical protein
VLRRDLGLPFCHLESAGSLRHILAEEMFHNRYSRRLVMKYIKIALVAGG